MENLLTHVLFFPIAIGIRKKLLIIIVRTFILLFFTTAFSLNPGNVLSQNSKIKIDADKTITVDEVFTLISSQTDYKFIYHEDLFKSLPKVHLKKGIIKTQELLNKSLSDGHYKFNLKNNTIVIINDNTIKQQQEFIVSGVVKDEKGITMAGVNVLVNTSRSGTVTDFDGSYKIEVKQNDNLSFSYIGFATQKFIISQETTLDVVLIEDSAKLDEILLIGYGQTTKRDATGSISSIAGENLARIKDPSLEASMAGRVAGAQVIKNSGQPGEGGSIKIRGVSSISGSNEPLYVIDGIPIEINYVAQDVNWNPSTYDLLPKTNPLSVLSPEDIESITILKDASAAAIYGSRAANGVVVVKTKSGKKGQKPRITIEHSTSVHQPINNIDVLNAPQFKDVISQANLDAGITLAPDHFFDGDTDWQDAITRTAQVSQWNLGVRGGGNKLTYSASFSALNQEGVVKGSDYDLYTARVGMTVNVLDNFKIGTTLNFSSFKQRARQRDYSLAMLFRPDMPIYNENGGFFSDPNNNFNNPLLSITNEKDERLGDRFLGSVYGEWDIIKGLTFKSFISIDKTDTKVLRLSPPSTTTLPSFPFSGVRYDNTSDQTSIVFDNTLSFKKIFNNSHTLDLLAGISWNTINSNFRSIQSANFVSDAQTNLSAANDIISYSDGNSPSGLSSLFGRVNYNFKDKYLATFTLRRDGSTKFGPGNQFGIFPSGALAWVVSNEPFLKSSKTINELKLRASAGVTGSASFADFLFQNFYGSGFIYNGVNGRRPIGQANPDIKWERTKQLDLGLDFSIFKSAITGTINYYEKNTDDLILSVNLQPESGFVSQFQNVGDITNNGFEFELNANIVNHDNLKWRVGGNITFNRNKIEKLNGGFGDQYTQYSILREGEAFGSFYGLQQETIFQEQVEVDNLNTLSPTGFYQTAGTTVGDIKYTDINGDDIINDEDRTIIGDPNPDYFGGFFTDLSYKNLSLNVLFQYSVGNDMYIADYRNRLANSIVNLGTDVLNAWTPENTNTTQPRNALNDPNQTFRNSDAYVYDASYLRLKNISLAYTFPKKGDVLSFFNNLRVYVSGTNLLTFTDYPGLDPENNSVKGTNSFYGVDLSVYPQTKYYTLGVSASF